MPTMQVQQRELQSVPADQFLDYTQVVCCSLAAVSEAGREEDYLQDQDQQERRGRRGAQQDHQQNQWLTEDLKIKIKSVKAQAQSVRVQVSNISGITSVGFNVIKELVAVLTSLLFDLHSTLPYSTLATYYVANGVMRWLDDFTLLVGVASLHWLIHKSYIIQSSDVDPLT